MDDQKLGDGIQRMVDALRSIPLPEWIRERSKPFTPEQRAEFIEKATYENAMKSFSLVSDNIYQNKKLGRNRQKEANSICDCLHMSDSEHEACGERCINRLTHIECNQDACHFGDRCQNQRFQRKQFVRLKIVWSVGKGYGLCASANISKGTLLCEYVGEVIDHQSVLERMQEYDVEGVRHWYFMELQKDEYIDATKKGGVARFVNHSCNPNCIVEQWTVRRKVTLGIFAKRDIEQGAEVTINYKMDCYGDKAQPCYCREQRCTGFIDGKIGK